MLSDSGELVQAVELLEKTPSPLSLVDKYSCKVTMALDGWSEGPSREQILAEAQSRGLPEDSLLTWRLEFALQEAFEDPFFNNRHDSKVLLQRLAQEAERRRPDDSITTLVRAITHFQSREFPRCRKLVDTALLRWPHSFRFRLLAGRCLVAQGKYDSALIAFEPLYQSWINRSFSFRKRDALWRNLEDWYGAAKVGSHEVGARQFRWDVEDCGHSFQRPNWYSFAGSACRIQELVYSADSASHCQKEPLSLGDLGRGRAMVKTFGRRPKCPDWAKPTAPFGSE